MFSIATTYTVGIRDQDCVGSLEFTAVYMPMHASAARIELTMFGLDSIVVRFSPCICNPNVMLDSVKGTNDADIVGVGVHDGEEEVVGSDVIDDEAVDDGVDDGDDPTDNAADEVEDDVAVIDADEEDVPLLVDVVDSVRAEDGLPLGTGD